MKQHPSWCCQRCGEPIGWIGRFLFPFLHLCKTEWDNLEIFSNVSGILMRRFQVNSEYFRTFLYTSDDRVEVVDSTGACRLIFNSNCIVLLPDGVTRVGRLTINEYANWEFINKHGDTVLVGSDLYDVEVLVATMFIMNHLI